jgi:uncharacterized protein YndB with AHSA1/START domain
MFSVRHHSVSNQLAVLPDAAGISTEGTSISNQTIAVGSGRLEHHGQAQPVPAVVQVRRGFGWRKAERRGNMLKYVLPNIALLLVCVGFGSGPAPPAAAAEQESGNPSISIHQEVDIAASPQRVYEALLDGKQFTAFSARPAEIERAVGGAFSLFGGHIVGRNLELVPNQRIVQAWRVVAWPEGDYSIARFELKAQGTGTHLVLDHVGFPAGLHDHLAEGWNENYWSLLKKYFP